MLGHSTMLADDSRSWRGTLPAILHNETYYSWCATTHVMSCDRSAASTGMALLGTAHAARQHDLPARISALPLLHGKSPIELVTALRKHTIAGYYLPFLCADKQMLVGVAISSNTSTHWRRHVSGVSRSRPTDHPLKWCQHCKDSDIATVGRAYWHVDWQYPTNLICAAHDMPLSIVPGSSKRWLLPHQLPAEHPSDSLSSSHTLAAKTLAAIGSTLPTIESVDMQSLRFATLDRLRDIGVIHSLTRSSHERISRWFLSTSVSAYFSTNPALQQFHQGDWVPELLWRKKLDTALRWVTLWSALDWSSPAQAARAFEQAANGTTRSQGTQLLLFEPAPNAVAPAHVWAAFSTCDSYAEVMHSLQVSRGDVVRWLEQDPQLRAQWKQRLKLGRQQEYVDRIRTVAAGSPQLTRHALEVRCSKELNWLREHAPVMLHSLLKSIPGRASLQRHLFG